MKKFIPVLLFFLLVFVAGYIQQADSDLYGHFVIGNVIAHHGIIHHEVVSQAGPSRPYIPIEWLFQLGLYTFLTTFGFSFYHIFNGIFTILQIGILFILFRKVFKLNLFYTCMLCSSFLLLNYQFLVQRPQIVADTLLLLTMLLVYTYLLKSKNYLYLLPVITYIWTNLHPSFVVGILFCIGYSGICLLGIFGKNRKFWLKKSGMLLLVGIGMVVASILPPQNFGEYQDLLLMYKYNYLMRVVNQEWSPLFASTMHTIFYTSLICLGLLFSLIVLLKNRKNRFFKRSLLIFPLIIFLPYGYVAIRNMYFGYLTIILLVGWVLVRLRFSTWSQTKKIIFILLALGILTCELWYSITNYILATSQWPEKAANFVLKENIQGNMFNQFDQGDYLEYRLYPSKKVFMDGRAEPFFSSEMLDWYNLQTNDSKPITLYQNLFNYVFNKYNFSYAVLVTNDNSSGIVLSNMLKKNSQWFLVNKDPVSEVWVKNDGKNTQLLNAFKENKLPQVTSSTKIFSNPDMNITFNYPGNLELSQINSHFISLKNPSSTSADSTLYIFETSITTNTKAVDIPYAIRGTLTKQTPVPLRDFTAKQYVYMDGKYETDFLTLRKNQEFIMVKIPTDSSSVTDAITDFVDSVKILN